MGTGRNIYISARLRRSHAHIQNDFVEDVDVEELYELAINGVVDQLEDPNCGSASQRLEEERIRTRATNAGVGNRSHIPGRVHHGFRPIPRRRRKGV